MKVDEKSSESLLFEEKENLNVDEEICIEQNLKRNTTQDDIYISDNNLLDDDKIILKDTNQEECSVKSWNVTLTFCIILGFIGFHRFYVGKAGTAILMLFTLGGFGIWILVDLVCIIINNFTDEDGRVIKRRCSIEQN